MRSGPWGGSVVDYEDPHSAMPDPNHMFSLMFQSLVTRLSDGGHSPTREYPFAQVREKFNADWAAAAEFDIDSGFATNHRQALIIAIHKPVYDLCVKVILIQGQLEKYGFYQWHV